MKAKFLALLAGLVLAAVLPSVVGAPALASGTQNVNPPKACFVNKSGQPLYFRAVYSGKVTGGTKLGDGGKFCSTKPVPNALRISRAKDSKVLCNRKVGAGRTYTVTALSTAGKCSWSLKAG